MNYKIYTRSLIALLILMTCNLVAGIKENAQKVLSEKKDAVVHISATITMDVSVAGQRMPVPDRPIKSTATILNKNGLIVLPLDILDPSKQMKARVKLQLGGQDFEIKAFFKNVKVNFSDGTELPAKVVLKDEDRNLAFLKVDLTQEDAKDLKFSFIELNAKAKVKLLDEVFVLTRLPKALYGKPALYLGQISCIIKRPKNIIVTTIAKPGAPVFNTQGQAIAISSVSFDVPAAKVLSLMKEAEAAAAKI